MKHFVGGFAAGAIFYIVARDRTLDVPGIEDALATGVAAAIWGALGGCLCWGLLP